MEQIQKEEAQKLEAEKPQSFNDGSPQPNIGGSTDQPAQSNNIYEFRQATDILKYKCEELKQLTDMHQKRLQGVLNGIDVVTNAVNQIFNQNPVPKINQPAMRNEQLRNLKTPRQQINDSLPNFSQEYKGDSLVKYDGGTPLGGGNSDVKNFIDAAEQMFNSSNQSNNGLAGFLGNQKK